ncbi:WS/DGAT domain-containing protein [Nocardioides sp. B-3]|uniref:WS/DGAT domain-containing protein n=1 Tax=Nocardioides sp. B-3 TaxID=2895565 RepID=UPI002152049F|nr:WS/DGAT domain-containing protein [Nocardioides sp. B-3]
MRSQDWAEFASPSTFGLAVRAYAGLRLAEKHPVVHNLVVSNVPGPPVPLYFVGARIEGMFAFGPVFHGAGLNITVMSNNGEMQVGVIACRESVADVDDWRSASRPSWKHSRISSTQLAPPCRHGDGRLDEGRHEELGLQHARRVTGRDLVHGGAGDPAGRGRTAVTAGSPGRAA